jgi:hypothetical protein
MEEGYEGVEEQGECEEGFEGRRWVECEERFGGVWFG